MPVKERPILFSGPMIRALLDGRKTQTRRILKLDVPSDADEAFFWSGEDLRRKGWRNVSEPGLWARRNGRDGYIQRVGPCPYGVPGERLWVKESWWIATPYSYGTTSGGCELDPPPLASRKRDPIHYAADGSPPNCHNRHYGPDGLRGGWFAAPDPYAVWVRRPSIHMPRWASRLTLEITEVRVERLQDISDRGQPNDCIAEGVFADDFAGKASDWLERGFSSIEKARIHDLWTSINGPESWDANPWVWAVSFRVLERA